MTTWLVWTGDKEHDPVAIEAEAVDILSDGSLSLGIRGDFRPTAIFAPGAWTRVRVMPSADKLRLLKECAEYGMTPLDIAIEEALAKNP